MTAIFFFFLLSAIHIYLATSLLNCNASKAYVQITLPSSLSTTITSSKTAFPPHSYYYIPSTQLIQLNSSTDDICSENGINSNISNKILLLFETTTQDCSSHYQIYIAQQHNASAVLLANTDISTNSDIEEDGITTSIPSRRIPYNDGLLLQNATLSAEAVQIEIGCFNTSYPVALCVSDSEGDKWYLDGNYQQIYGKALNNYPVYKKEGYAHLQSPLYLFQHKSSISSSNNSSELHWSITLDPTLSTDAYIRAQCGDSSLTDPSMCAVWNVYDIGEDSLEYYAHLNVTANLCTASDSHMCIKSKQSNLAGMHGTYTQTHKNVPRWFRQLDDCDNRPGWLLFDGYGRFILLDSINGWIIAECTLSAGYAASDAYLPSLCTEWYTIINDSLVEMRALDDTFTVSMDSECASYECVQSEVPQTLCMEESSVMHGFLEVE